MTKLLSEKTSREMFDHLNRMQKRIMSKDSQTTWKEFQAESLQDQRSYYNWMCRQAGELCDLM